MGWAHSVVTGAILDGRRFQRPGFAGRPLADSAGVARIGGEERVHHFCARRRYSSALLATTPLVRPPHHKRRRRHFGSGQIRKKHSTQRKTPPYSNHAGGSSGEVYRAVDGQMRRPATARTMPLTHAAKQANSTKSLRRKAMQLPPRVPPCCSAMLPVQAAPPRPQSDASPNKFVGIRLCPEPDTVEIVVTPRGVRRWEMSGSGHAPLCHHR
jgi:hypothetical protein